jgi:hypothetical protein
MMKPSRSPTVFSTSGIAGEIELRDRVEDLLPKLSDSAVDRAKQHLILRCAHFSFLNCHGRFSSWLPDEYPASG